MGSKASSPSEAKRGGKRIQATRATRTDGELTRMRILDAAGQLFSTGGYAETTSKAVAEHAGVDLASINYHFGSRAGLYRAVLVDAHGRLVSLDDLQNIAAQDLPAPDKLRQVFEVLLQSVAKRSDLHVQLFAREVLAPSTNLRAIFATALAPKVAIVVRILSQITGIAEDDPALSRCLISTVAPCLMLLVANRRMPGPIGRLAGMSTRELVDHVHTYTLGGLQAIVIKRSSEKKQSVRRRRASPA